MTEGAEVERWAGVQTLKLMFEKRTEMETRMQ